MGGDISQVRDLFSPPRVRPGSGILAGVCSVPLLDKLNRAARLVMKPEGCNRIQNPRCASRAYDPKILEANTAEVGCRTGVPVIVKVQQRCKGVKV